MRISIEYKLAIGFIIAIFLALAFVIGAGENMSSVVDFNKKTSESQVITNSINGARSAVLEIESSSRGYVLTNNPLFLNEYNENIKKVNECWINIVNLQKNNPFFINRKSLIENLVLRRVSFCDSSIKIRNNFDQIHSSEFIASGRGDRLTAKICKELDAIENYQYIINNVYNNAENAAAKRTIVLFSILVLLIVLILFLVYVLFKKDLTWRRKSRKELKMVSQSLELNVQERIKDLTESELKYRFLAEHSTDVISLHDLNINYTYISDSITKIAGYKPSEMLGESAYDFMHPDDVKYMKMRIAGLPDRTSKEFSQFRFRTKDGNYVWLESGSNFIYDDKGNVSGFIVNTRDISIRKKSEDQLIASQANLKSIINNTKDIILLLDKNYIIQSFNIVFTEIVKSNYGIEPVVGENIFKYVIESNHKQYKKIYDRAFAGETFITEVEYNFNETTHYLEMSLNPIKHNDEISGVSVFSTDITNRKYAEQELVSSRSRMNAVLENSTDGIWSMDTELKLTGYNNLYKQITKKIMNIDVHIGMKVLEYLDEEPQVLWKGFYERAIRGERFSKEITEFYEGSDHTNEISFNPIIVDKKVVGIAVFAHDITLKKLNELKLLESGARMIAVLENSSDSIWSIDKNFKLISFNKSFYESTKLFYDFEPYIGLSILEQMNAVSKERWFQLYQRALNGEHFSDETEDTSIGLELFFDTSFNPIIINNEITGVAIFARDITSRKTVERQLEYKVKELNTFMYKATHDLRSPLVSVMGLVQLVKDHKMDDEMLKYIDMINLSVLKMDNLLIDLVKIVNVSQGKLLFEEIDFNSIVDDILLSLSHYPDFSEIIFRRQIHSDAVFISDKRLLHSVIQNLIENAMKYKRASSITESIIIITINVTAKQAQIGITDNGMGIPEKIQDRVFEMFYRGVTSSPGTGLGLYIVKTSVEKMDGKIILSSIEGKGTSINIIIPNK